MNAEKRNIFIVSYQAIFIKGLSGDEDAAITVILHIQVAQWFKCKHIDS